MMFAKHGALRLVLLRSLVALTVAVGTMHADAQPAQDNRPVSWAPKPDASPYGAHQGDVIYVPAGRWHLASYGGTPGQSWSTRLAITRRPGNTHFWQMDPKAAE